MTTATVENKKGRGRPRTKPLHRVQTGVYESKDGRFIIRGIGKRGRKQEWWVEDTVATDSPIVKNTYFDSLNKILSVLSRYYPSSF